MAVAKAKELADKMRMKQNQTFMDNKSYNLVMMSDVDPYSQKKGIFPSELLLSRDDTNKIGTLGVDFHYTSGTENTLGPYIHVADSQALHSTVSSLRIMNPYTVFNKSDYYNKVYYPKESKWSRTKPLYTELIDKDN